MKHIRTYLRSQRFALEGLTIGLVLCLVLLAACGTNAGTTTTTGSSGVTTTTTNTPLVTVQCGAVHTMRLLVVPADKDRVKGVEDCFWQAYQQCHPATLIYAQNNLDTGTIHNFSLKSENGQCVITDGVQHVIAPHPPQSTTNYTCTGLTRQNDGLHFLSCGEVGNVLVPEASA